MTASSPAGASAPHQAGSSSGSKQSRQPHQQPTTTTNSLHQQASSSAQTCCPSLNSSAAFQQVKQTQASLARLTRVHQHQSLQQQNQPVVSAVGSQNNQSSQQHLAKLTLDAGQQQQKPTTFVDCLIRRFKNCFDEDFCTVPMFVVGSLSPGSDGTHLILPPCVSLGRQNINRFSSPKNLRLMNPIRESCRSIEELDLGGNKLTDLIEVYKILQCTPNLRFLNLSENDLSRTSPVAMASLSTSTLSASVSSGGSGNNMIGFTSLTSANQQCSLSTGPFNQRTCLAPLNQNHQGMGARRHSSLGQPSASSSRSSALSNSRSGTPVHLRAHQTISRVAEARRMAAANALAQSKKTSSAVASKLANSAAVSGQLSRQVASSTRGTRNNADSSSSIISNQTPSSASQRLQGGQKSTMHLARSLSSLSAKDIRAANSSISRLSAHRASIRNEMDGRTISSANRRSPTNSSGRFATYGMREAQAKQMSGSTSSQQLREKQEAASAASNKITTSRSHQKLYAEPIVESEDVDMSGEQQQQISLCGQSSNSGSCNNQASASSTTLGHQQQQQSPPQKNLQTTTGSNTLRSFCNNNNNNNSLLATCQQQQQQTTNFRRTFESIKALALNNTGCQWKVVCSILSRMPNLEELHLSLNNYEKIDLDTNEFKHLSLKRLYLCNNPKLTNWEELDKLLIAFPSLEALSIADCNISQIPDNLDRAREWRKLCGLNINGWPIKEWPVVERLNQLPSLVDLKCRNLDVLNSIDEPRHHLIARLPKLQRLNGSEIEEREHAERAFLRFFMVNSHLERPARFHELMQIYGEVPQNIDVDVDLSPPSQARVRVIYLNRNHYCKADEDDVLMSEDFLLKLMDNIDASSNVQQPQNMTDVGGNLQENMEVAEVDHSGPVRLFKDEGQEVMALDVDLRQSVRKFKSTIASLFGLQSQNLILYYIDHEMVGLMGPELIKHNQKKLWNYNVQDGDQFIVEDR